MKRRSLTRVIAGALGLLVLAAGWMLLGPTQVGGTTSYAVIVGTSMEPKLHRGDLAVIREQNTYQAGDIVLYESPQLRSNVLHRIVGVQGERFVLKGDNNDFLDGEQPSEAQIVGKLWLSAPQVGRVTEWLRTPFHAALLVGLATLLALGGRVGAGAARRRRTPGAVPPERATGPAGAGPGDPLPWLVGLGVASVLFAVLALVSFTRQATVTEPVAEASVHQGRFDYAASVPRNEVYPDGRVTTGEPVFLRLVDRLRVSFAYRLEAAGEASEASGKARLDLRVSDGRGWERTLQLAPDRNFRGGEAVVAGTIDLRAIQALVAKVRALTGTAQSAFSVTVLPRISVSGEAGQPIGAAFTPSLPFDLDDLRLQPSGEEAGEGVGPFAPREAVAGTHVVADELELGAFSLPVRTARGLSLIGLLASLLLGAIALAALLQRYRGGERDRIAARYGHLVVPVLARSQEWARVTELADMESLVRLAEHHDRIILHVVDGSDDAYLVEDDGSVYRYRTGRPPAAPPPAPVPPGRRRRSVPPTTAPARWWAPPSARARAAGSEEGATVKIGRFVQIALIGVAVGLVLISALAATNTVPGSRAERDVSAISVDAKKPKPECNGITLTAIVTGVNGTNASELIVGTGASQSFRGQNGNDCILGGGGNDTLRGDGGTDVCIGGPGTDTFHATCETQIQ